MESSQLHSTDKNFSCKIANINTACLKNKTQNDRKHCAGPP